VNKEKVIVSSQNLVNYFNTHRTVIPQYDFYQIEIYCASQYKSCVVRLIVFSKNYSLEHN